MKRTLPASIYKKVSQVKYYLKFTLDVVQLATMVALIILSLVRNKRQAES